MLNGIPPVTAVLLQLVKVLKATQVVLEARSLK
jgi:hypothetical protein